MVGNILRWRRKNPGDKNMNILIILTMLFFVPILFTYFCMFLSDKIFSGQTGAAIPGAILGAIICIASWSIAVSYIIYKGFIYLGNYGK